jgi:hypothetical protein
VVLAARAARDNSHDNHQNRRLVSAAFFLSNAPMQTSCNTATSSMH